MQPMKRKLCIILSLHCFSHFFDIPMLRVQQREGGDGGEATSLARLFACGHQPTKPLSSKAAQEPRRDVRERGAGVGSKGAEQECYTRGRRRHLSLSVITISATHPRRRRLYNIFCINNPVRIWLSGVLYLIPAGGLVLPFSGHRLRPPYLGTLASATSDFNPNEADPWTSNWPPERTSAQSAGCYRLGSINIKAIPDLPRSKDRKLQLQSCMLKHLSPGGSLADRKWTLVRKMLKYSNFSAT
nr:hypothetical protein Iba_chr06bCG4110 [Ipomoea batatas]